MPRTVEHIVACHQAADALRRQGKPVWAATISLSGLLPAGCTAMPEDLSDAQAASLGVKIAQTIRQNRYVEKQKLLVMGDAFDFELDDIVEGFEDLRADKETGRTGLDDLNNFLEQLYDWADHKRIWIVGLRH